MSVLNPVEQVLKEMDYPIVWQTRFMDKICEYVYNHPVYNQGENTTVRVPYTDILTSAIDITNFGFPADFIDWLASNKYIYKYEYNEYDTDAELGELLPKTVYIVIKKDINLFKERFEACYL